MHLTVEVSLSSICLASFTMREQCVPGSLPPPPAQEPGDEATVWLASPCVNSVYQALFPPPPAQELGDEATVWLASPCVNSVLPGSLSSSSCTRAWGWGYSLASFTSAQHIRPRSSWHCVSKQPCTNPYMKQLRGAIVNVHRRQLAMKKYILAIQWSHRYLTVCLLDRGNIVHTYLGCPLHQARCWYRYWGYNSYRCTSFRP